MTVLPMLKTRKLLCVHLQRISVFSGFGVRNCYLINSGESPALLLKPSVPWAAPENKRLLC